MSNDRREGSRWTTRLYAAGAGLLAATAGVAASALVAGFFTGLPTPILSVGNAAVDLAPPFLKDFAVERFGTADKTVLLAGIYTVVAGVAAFAGLVGLRRPRLALALTALLGAVAVVAAGTDRTSLVQFPLTVLPALVALVVSLVSLAWMLTGLHHRRRRTPRRPPRRSRPRSGRVPTTRPVRTSTAVGS